MNIEEKYEELRRKWSEYMPGSWHDLDDKQQMLWTLLIVEMDRNEQGLRKAKEIIGHLIMDNPDLLPMLDL